MSELGEHCPFTGICSQAYVQERADLLRTAPAETVALCDYTVEFVRDMVNTIDKINLASNGNLKNMLQRAPAVSQRCGSCALHKNIFLRSWHDPQDPS